MDASLGQDAFETLKQIHAGREFEVAFHEATGLQFSLKPVPTDPAALLVQPGENPLCALICSTVAGQAMCRRVQSDLRQRVEHQLTPHQLQCSAGLTVVAVPVVVSGVVVAILHTNRLFVREPRPQDLARFAEQLGRWGRTTLPGHLKAHFAGLPVISRQKLNAVIKLLGIYAEHVGELAGRRLLAEPIGRPSLIGQALAFMHEHQAERLPLRRVARQTHVSLFYFCKLFKKTMGMTFTSYLARTRIEHAKDMLLNPTARISDVAFSAGFGSISHFNRAFKHYTGLTPTAYRTTAGGSSPGSLRPAAYQNPGESLARDSVPQQMMRNN